MILQPQLFCLNEIISFSSAGPQEFSIFLFFFTNSNTFFKYWQWILYLYQPYVPAKIDIIDFVFLSKTLKYCFYLLQKNKLQ